MLKGPIEGKISSPMPGKSVGHTGAASDHRCARGVGTVEPVGNERARTA